MEMLFDLKVTVNQVKRFCLKSMGKNRVGSFDQCT